MTINVMVNGVPGKMASKVADYITIKPRIESEMKLSRYSLTGPDIREEIFMGGTGWKHSMVLIKPGEREEKIKKIIDSEGPFISVDYTHPSAVNGNADFYCRHNLPFVMGTTGGDRAALEQRVKDSDVVAVIAPNMAKQIVAFQAMMEYIADTFPEAFKGYSLKINESHQKGKADTSGTAKAMVEYFNKLGIPFEKEKIVQERTQSKQLKMGVPEWALTGHGWHTYNLKAGSGAKDPTEVLDIFEKAMLEYAAENFPGSFKNYRLDRRSYPTPGTAIELEPFKKLKKLGFLIGLNTVVPREDTLFATSEDSTVMFEFGYNLNNGRFTITHNVNGRDIYAVGTLDAIRFLDAKVSAGEKGRVYSMIDVLKGK